MIDGYAIDVYNNNIDDKWHEIAKFEIGSDLDKAHYEFAKEVDNASGLLKVLRDYKHYFRVRAFTTQDGKITYSPAPKSIDEDKNETESIWKDGLETDYVKWGARQITDAELTKATMLILSDAFYRANDGKNLNFELKEGKDGAGFEGSYKIKHEGRMTMRYFYTLTNYSPIFDTPAAAKTKVLDISVDNNVYRKSTGAGLSVSGSYPEKFDTATIKVNGADTYASIIKNKTVTFTLSSADKNECNGTLSCGDFSITLTNDNRKDWLPMALLNQPTWYNNDTNYGWW
jgi:hypothetical protein